MVIYLITEDQVPPYGRDSNMVRQPSPTATRSQFDMAAAKVGGFVPDTWKLDVVSRSDTGGTVRLTSPDDTATIITIMARDRLATREAAALLDPAAPTIIAAPWLSPRTRELLKERGFNYIDQTGNASLKVDRPGLVVRTEGALRDPSPPPRTRPNLRGPRAWALMRTLVEVEPPYGVTDLSRMLGMDPGYVSRLLATLAEELLIIRKPRGPVESVEWESLLRQIAVDYSLYKSNETTSWIAGAGPEQFLRDIAAIEDTEWAVTGSFAAERLVSVAPAVVAVVYTEDPEHLAEISRLRQVRIGGNVRLARPYDPIVFERTWTRNSMVYASIPQVAVDCLTGPARMPAEGESLLAWMRTRLSDWRCSPLRGGASTA